MSGQCRDTETATTKEHVLSVQPQAEALPPPPPLDAGKFTFVLLVHIVSLISIGLWIYGTITVSGWTLFNAFMCFAISSTTITAGYHRLYSHRTYRAAWPLKLFFLITGTGAVQGSALQWAAQHRDHHTFCDDAKDPYNINLGFWHAHIGWVIRQTQPDYNRVKDLSAEWMNRFQHKWFGPLSIITGFLIPAAIGALYGEFLSALLIAGAVRLVIQWHMTFCVNSVAHWWGSQKYSTKHTARGSWWLSFLVWGEMDHNFHHTFPNDFRTGTRWFDFDPGKWFIWVCSKIGLAQELKVTDPEKIERVRVQLVPSAD